ncbi:dihydroorotate dehydrogenase [Flammula alnicola]|nr:dihydroorotate dehydrogenase [Flammula alnicola]
MPILNHGIPHTLARTSFRAPKHVHSTRHLFTKSAPVERNPIRTALYTTAFVVSAGLFTVYYLDSRSALHRYVLTPIIRNILDPETGHKLAVKTLKSGLGPKDPVRDDERLKCQLWGEAVSNPIGLAAGFDKDGEAIDGLFDLGFGWVEIGSVTPKPQPGNPRPRMFRLDEDGAVINRYGFPSQGHSSVLARVRARIPTFFSGPDRAALREDSMLAVNLGKNKESPADSIDDFVAGVRTFGPYSDVLVVNVSSPNTPGLRGLQNKDVLERLLDGVTKARDELTPSPLTSRKPKVVLKIAPDLEKSQIIEMADVIRKSNIDGVIVSNTTIQRPKTLVNGQSSANKSEAGGLSGPPIKPFSLKALQTLRAHLPSSIPLIGCGGIASGKDALDYAKSGASMVQVYTSFGYDGVGACRRIKDELVDELAKEGKSWEQVVHEAVEQLSWKEPIPEKKPEPTVQQLISEAEELKTMLDKLGDEMRESTSA